MIDFTPFKELAAIRKKLPKLLTEVMEQDAIRGYELLKAWGEQTLDVRQVHAQALEALEKGKQLA